MNHAARADRPTSGGGNSAGQAAVFLARTCRHVNALVRSTGLAESMSRSSASVGGIDHRKTQSSAATAGTCSS